MQIGPYQISPGLILAPMSGITDKPFRQLCRQFGAGLAVAEMTCANPDVWLTRHTRKSLQRMDYCGEKAPIVAQIVGTLPHQLADVARHHVDHGAQIIDINMGCPAKKVCQRQAGAALLRSTELAAQIFRAVVSAVAVPVTVKIRTGWTADRRNCVEIARIAEQQGIAAITVHGRSADQRFTGEVDYQLIASVKAAVRIPVIANGDIDSGCKAAEVMRLTDADAMMVGRAALGRPWVFREIVQYLATGQQGEELSLSDKYRTILTHVHQLHAFYGDPQAIGIVRKHIGWYLNGLTDSQRLRQEFNAATTFTSQLDLIHTYFH